MFAGYFGFVLGVIRVGLGFIRVGLRLILEFFLVI